MKDRRRSPRIPVLLEIELRRSRWERHVTEDVSRRGLYVRTAGPCPTGQLIQIRVVLPRDEQPLEMMARVARRVAPAIALQQGRLPGVGLEFFCLSNTVLQRWDRFIQVAARCLDVAPDADAYALYRMLETPDRLPGAAGVTETGSARGDSLTARGRGEGMRAGGEAVDNRSNLIFRPLNLEQLEKFIADELSSGRFGLRIPYRMEDDAAVNLRVIHPRTQEEFLLAGRIHHDTGKDGYQIRFDDAGEGVVRAFQRFAVSGQADSAQEAA